MRGHVESRLSVGSLCRSLTADGGVDLLLLLPRSCSSRARRSARLILLLARTRDVAEAGNSQGRRSREQAAQGSVLLHRTFLEWHCRQDRSMLFPGGKMEKLMRKGHAETKLMFGHFRRRCSVSVSNTLTSVRLSSVCQVTPSRANLSPTAMILTCMLIICDMRPMLEVREPSLLLTDHAREVEPKSLGCCSF
jgi:hypothetical protein